MDKDSKIIQPVTDNELEGVTGGFSVFKTQEIKKEDITTVEQVSRHQGFKIYFDGGDD